MGDESNEEVISIESDGDLPPLLEEEDDEPPAPAARRPVVNAAPAAAAPAMPGRTRPGAFSGASAAATASPVRTQPGADLGRGLISAQPTGGSNALPKGFSLPSRLSAKAAAPEAALPRSLLGASGKAAASAAAAGRPGVQVQDTKKFLTSLMARGGEADEEGKDEDDGERNLHGSTTVPFPTELRNRRQALSRAQRMGDPEQEALANFEMAELHFHSARYGRAIRSVLAAFELSQRGGMQAKAVRLAVRANIAREDIQDAMQIAEAYKQHLAKTTDKSNAVIAQGLTALAFADVHLATSRPKMALLSAEEALSCFRELDDEANQAVALQLKIVANLRLGGAMRAQQAMQTAEEALALLRSMQSEKEECEALLAISNAHLTRLEYQDAYVFAKAASELAERTGNGRGAVAALRELATIMLKAGEEPDMIGMVANQAVELAQHCGDWLGEIQARQAVANAHHSDGFLNSALEALAPALELARKLRERSLISMVLDAMTKVHGKESELGLKLMLEEVKQAQASGNNRRELAALSRVVTLQMAFGGPKDALETANEAMTLAKASGEQRCEAEALGLIATVHRSQKRFPEALDLGMQSKKAHQANGDWVAAIDALQLLTNIHEDMNNDTKVLENCVERTKMYKTAGWQDKEASAHLAYARELVRLRGPKEAMAATKEALTLYRSMSDKQGEAATLLEQSKNQVLGGKNAQESLRSAKASRNLFRDIGDKCGEAMALIDTANIHSAHCNFTESQNCSSEALVLCQEAGDRKEEARALQAMANAHTLAIELEHSQSKTAPDAKALEDALLVVAESIAFFQAIGEEAYQAYALLQISTLHRINENAVAGLEAAKRALMFSESLNDGRLQALALLKKAEAHIVIGQRAEALEAAKDAKEIFGQAEDQDGFNSAVKIIEKTTTEDEFAEIGEESCGPTPIDENVKRKAPPAGEGPYYAVGTWDDWADFVEVQKEGDGAEAKYSACVPVRRAPGNEEFQIVCKRDWAQRFHPAAGGKVLGPDDMHGVNWQVQVPNGCEMLRLIWDARLPRAVDWSFVMFTGADVSARDTPKSAPGADNSLGKFGPNVAKLLRRKAAVEEQVEEDDNRLSSGAQALLGLGKKKPAAASASKSPVKAFSQENGDATAKESQRTLQSSLVESEEVAIQKQEAAEQRRAKLLAAPKQARPWSQPAAKPAARQSQPMAATRKEAPTRRADPADQDDSDEVPLAQEEGEIVAEAPYEQNQPDQALRKRQMKAQNETNTLDSVLMAVRKDWSAVDRSKVVNKLQKIDILTSGELLEKLRTHGVREFNSLFDDVGEKRMRDDTVGALLTHLESLQMRG